MTEYTVYYLTKREGLWTPMPNQRLTAREAEIVARSLRRLQREVKILPTGSGPNGPSEFPPAGG